MEYNKTCPTCKVLFIAKRKDKAYCEASCRRKAPHNREKRYAATKICSKKNQHKPQWRFTKLQSKCKLKKYELDIDLVTYTDLLNQGCHYCGTSLIEASGCGLDRIDNSSGYTKDNIVSCCGKCNQIRNVHLTKEEMEVAMKAVLKYRDGVNNGV